MNELKVTLKGRRDDSYRIHVGEGILEKAAMEIARSGIARRCVVVTDNTVDALHGQRVQAALEKAGLRIDRFILPPGEENKTIESVVAIAACLTSLGADRQTLLVALGGGVIGDMTGFAASIYMRGIPFVQMPTTLLAQVDSSIGGKTGVDAVSGKNMLGTFHQPRAVFIDIDFLKTLPEEIFRSGLAEAIKYGAIENPALLYDIEKAASENALRNVSFLLRIVHESCRIKKGIVELDEREGGLRRILNFGHTIGHAVEAASGFVLSHGEAVAIGMTAATRLSEKLHGLPFEEGERIISAIRAVGLPCMIPADIGIDAVIAKLSLDKKSRDDVHKKDRKVINYIMISRLGKPFAHAAIDDDILRETLTGMMQ
jgi:3-dehydroquinate synthase